MFLSKNSNEENGGVDFFLRTCSKVRNKHGLCKEKHMRGNQIFYEQTYLERDYEETSF